MTKKAANLIEYSPQNLGGIAGYLIAILIGVILSFRYWYLLSFNSLMVGYYLFKELRLATVFYAVFLRVVLYPISKIGKRFEKLTAIAEGIHQETVGRTKNPLSHAKAARDWIKSNKKTVLFNFFYLCFFTMNAVSVGKMFFDPFTKVRVDKSLRIEAVYPQFPISTKTTLPLIGSVDLAEYSPKLNMISAVGAAIIGLIEVFVHKKTERRELLLYIIGFPVGAYFITMIVPSGFEFALTIFELLTIAIMGVESAIAKSTAKKAPQGNWRKQAYR